LRERVLPNTIVFSPEGEAVANKVTFLGETHRSSLDLPIRHLVVDQIDQRFNNFINPQVKVFALKASKSPDMELFIAILRCLPSLDHGEIVMPSTSSLVIQAPLRYTVRDEWNIRESDEGDSKKYTFTKKVSTEKAKQKN
jgi:hypothetical protein